MADARLGILISADTAQAQQGLATLNTALDKTDASLVKVSHAATSTSRVFIQLPKAINDTSNAASNAAGSFSQLQRQVAAFGGGVKTFTSSFQKIPSVVDPAEKSIKKIRPASNEATNSLINLGRVVQDAPFGFLGIANNLNPLIESFGRTGKAAGGFSGAMKALGGSLVGAGGIGLAVSAISAALIVFGDNLFGASRGISESKRELDALNNSISESKRRIDEVGGALNFLAQAGQLFGTIVGATEVDVLAGDVIATRDALFDAGQEVLKAQEVYRKAVRLNLDQANADSKKAEEEALSNLNDAFKKEADLREKDKLLTLRINASKIEGDRKATDQRKSIHEKFINDTISLAQALQTEFPALFPPTYFSALDSIQEKFKKASTSLKNFFDNLKGGFARSNTTVDISAAAVPIKIEPPTVTNMRPVADETVQGLTKLFKANPAPFTIVPDLDPIKSDKLRVITEDISRILSGSFLNFSEAIGEGLGEAISGKIEGFGQSIIRAIGSLIQEIGKALIKYGAIKLGLDKLLGPGGLSIPGGVAIGLGLTAIAFGQIFKNFSGARATGGPVSGGRSYLIGERGPELFIPQASGTIIPNNNLSGLQGFAQVIEIVGQTRASGSDLLTVWHRATRYNGRNT